MKNDDLSIKVTLIGESSVGKTCIINKFCKNIFEAEVDSTLGANYSQKKIEINGKKIKLDLWDTAGQEKYRAIGRHFYKESYIVCLVYDITNKESFEKIKEIWYPELVEYGEQYKIIGLIGNKVDLFLEEKVPEEIAKKYAEEINAVHKRTSALKGTGIEDLFNELTIKYLNEFRGQSICADKKKEENIVLDSKKVKGKNKSKRC